jgi:hypothetical protein
VPDEIKKAGVNNDNVNIRAVRKPPGKVVRAQAEANLRTTDNRNVVFIHLQPVRNVGSEVGQRPGLVTKNIRIARENVVLQHLADWAL